MAQDFRNVGVGRSATVEGEVVSSSTNRYEGAVQQGTPRALRNAYLLLAVSLIPAFLGGFVGKYAFPIGLLSSSPVLFFIGFAAVFYGLIFAIEKNNTSVMGIVLLEGFTFMLGFATGPLLMMASGFSNGTELVLLALMGTAGIFFGMSAIAATVKKPLTGLGNFLAVGAIVLMIAIVASLFFQIPALHLAITCGVLLFSTLAMLWRINMAYHDGQTNYISLTLGLVIDLYNVFTTLLRLLMVLSGRRD